MSETLSEYQKGVLKNQKFRYLLFSALIYASTFILIGIFYAIPQYTVWQQGLVGKAELARAQWNRQIMIQEAQSKEESAKLLAQAEVQRAHGVAQANQIIGQSLKNNEAYLRYLWIHSLQEGNSEVIYVPTEAGLPILEAGKRKSSHP
jgi:hypothetical protein